MVSDVQVPDGAPREYNIYTYTDMLYIRICYTTYTYMFNVQVPDGTHGAACRGPLRRDGCVERA